MFGTWGPRIGLVAVLVAVAAVVVIVAAGSSGGSDSSDPYTRAANRFCREASQRIADAARRNRKSWAKGDPQPTARSVFVVVGRLHVQLGRISDVSDEIAKTIELEEAEFELEQPLIALIHFTTESQIRAEIRKLLAIDARIKRSAVAVGADECARLQLATAFGA